MSLADDLDTLDTTRPGRKCWVGLWLTTLDDRDRAAVNAAMRSTTSSTQMHIWLAKHGHDVAMSSLTRHRRKMKGLPGCACDVTG